MKRLHWSATRAALSGFFIACGLPILAAELYPATIAPGNGVNWSVTVSLVDSTGAPVALASGDTELSCEGGALADTTEATSAAAGVATITYDASTNSNCEFGTLLVKGTNHLTSVATVHFVTDYSLVYVGTASAYDDTTPSGCDAGGASITLNTADQTGSATDGTYNGMWVQPSDGTGGTQNGRWASTAYTYNGTSKILCVDTPFVTALDNTSVVQIYAGYAKTPVTTSDIASANATATRDLNIEDQGGGVSLGCAMAVLLAYAAGDLVTTGGSSTYEDPSGTETRITGTVSSAGNRLAAAGCPTY
jgi:hypothetical protein